MGNFILISSLTPSSWEFLSAYMSGVTWTVPKTGWYRIFCIGKSGDGGDNASARNGSGGGGSGGLSASKLLLSYGSQIPLSFSNGIASFGNYHYATPGSNGNGQTGGAGGMGYNGNLANYMGGGGGRGGNDGSQNDYQGSGYSGASGDNGGMSGGLGGLSGSSGQPAGGGGGGGARLPGEAICRYISPVYTAQYRAGRGASQPSNGGDGSSADQYPTPSLNSNMILFGGGGGKGGNGPAGTQGGAKSEGTPAIIIIEKAL